jgi:cytochrome P450
MKIEDHSFMDADIQEAPYAYYDALLEQAPVYFMPQINAFVVCKYKDIQYVVAHPEIWSMNMRGLPAANMFKSKAAECILENEGFPRDTKFTTDPPEHTKYRSAVGSAFTPARVKSQAAFIQKVVDDLIEDMHGSTSCEFLRQFCWWLPIRVVTNLLGVPHEDAGAIKHWSDTWVEPLTYGLTEEREVFVAREEVKLQQYILKQLAQKRLTPGKDVLSDMLFARTNDGEGLPLKEIVGLSEHLIVGGHETATSALAAGMAILAQNPQIAAELRDNLQLVDNFVEEVLRMESPSQGFFRLAVQDHELRGVHIPKGAMVHLRFAAANRDPEQFADPAKFDLHRPNVKSHLAFSQGVHHCIGAHYARLELCTAFRSLLEAFDDIKLMPNHGRLIHLPGLSLRTLKEVHISYRPRIR